MYRIHVIVDMPWADGLYTYISDTDIQAGALVIVSFGADYAFAVVMMSDREPNDAELKPIAAIVRDNVCAGAYLQFLHQVSEHYSVSIAGLMWSSMPSLTSLHGIQSVSLVSEQYVADSDIQSSIMQALISAPVRKQKKSQSINTLHTKLKDIKIPMLICEIYRLSEKGCLEISRTAPSISATKVINAKKTDLSEDQNAAVKHIRNVYAGGGREALLHGVTGSGKTEIYCDFIIGCLQKGH